jgi:hypothetical protein
LGLAGALGVPVKSRLLARGPDTDDEVVPKGALRILVYELRTIARAQEETSSDLSPLEDLLWRFKLAVEVMNPEGMKKFANKGELDLQKVLCSHLLTFGALAIGTKFGQSESDVVVKKGRELMVVETKLVKTPPSAAYLAKAVVQLKKYMSQFPLAVRGALVVFNAGKFLLDAPLAMRVRGNCSVLVVNLGGVIPSGLTACYEIRDSRDDSEPFEVVRTAKSSKSK